MGDNIADLLQLWHQQPVLQIVTLAHSPACNSGSSAEMLRQSHWKTQIEGLMKRQFVPFSVHRARVCIRGSRWNQCHVPPYFFVPCAVNVLPPPPEQRIHPTGPPPHQTNFPKGSSRHQLAGSNACAFVCFLGVCVAVKSNSIERQVRERGERGEGGDSMGGRSTTMMTSTSLPLPLLPPP